MTYPGGKGNTYQTIINRIPPHNVYIEPFAGNAAVARMKRPAAKNILIDLDPEALDALHNIALPDNIAKPGEPPARWTLLQCDAITEFFPYFNFTGRQEFVYLDPPYLKSTRKQPDRDLYTYELTDTQHIDLLDIIKRLPCYVMISSYYSNLYADTLTGWCFHKFKVMTRGGSTATEYLWMNYTPPNELHDYRYLGRDFKERERIKKKKARWVQRLTNMPRLERLAMAAAIAECVEVIDGRSHHRI